MNKLLVLCCISIQLNASQTPHNTPVTPPTPPHKWNIDEPEKNIEYILSHQHLPRTKSAENLDDMVLREVVLQKYLKDEAKKNGLKKPDLKKD